MVMTATATPRPVAPAGRRRVAHDRVHQGPQVQGVAGAGVGGGAAALALPAGTMSGYGGGQGRPASPHPAGPHSRVTRAGALEHHQAPIRPAPINLPVGCGARPGRLQGPLAVGGRLALGELMDHDCGRQGSKTCSPDSGHDVP
jgi:hypothetical protein